MLKEAGFPENNIVYKQRLNRQSGVVMRNGWIRSIEMESGKTYRGMMFIDATYEGDLMAAAKVSAAAVMPWVRSRCSLNNVCICW